MQTNNPIAPYFLGAYAENNDEFENMWLEFFRDHVYWRRGFHPEDPPGIRPRDKVQVNYMEALADTKQVLHQLSARLKQSIPFFHPRYVGHMCSELLMPGQLAQMITTLYNPNNVTTDAAPVTVELELEAGRMIAQMLGFNIDSDNPNAAWGHLTSGGSVANYQSVWYFSALKYYPVALKCGLQGCDEIKITTNKGELITLSNWELMNLSFDEIVSLREQLLKQLQTLGKSRRAQILKQIREQRHEFLGPVDFLRQHSDINPPQWLVPTTAHYSWEKSSKIMGVGHQYLIKIPTDNAMRLDMDALDKHLQNCFDNKQPVLGIVGVLGSTEFGTIDPIHKIVELRNKWRAKGLDFFIHVDGAWGGYLSALFRDESHQIRSQEDMASNYNDFPNDNVYGAYRALNQVDTVTVDPHKLGYLPFGCGAFICRNLGARNFVMQDAAYVFEGDKYSQPNPELGQYIMEGSKPGSAAAAVWVSHKVLPLHHQAFGHMIDLTIKSKEHFQSAVTQVQEETTGRLTLCVPIEPETNLICVAVNHQSNHSMTKLNAVTADVYKQLRVDSSKPLQTQSFFGSSTKIFRRYLSDADAHSLCDKLGIPRHLFVEHPEEADQADHILVLRHTLMNPWLVQESKDYVQDYLTFLVKAFEQGFNA